MGDRHLIYEYTVGDKTWTLDFFDLTIDECAELRRLTGHRWAQLAIEHDLLDPIAVKALVWMARRKAGEKDLDFNDPSMNWTLREFSRKTLRDTEAEKAPDPHEPPAPETASRKPVKKPPASRSKSTS